tara:strand:- start:2039 stop:3178 length:1140 start_codon:yes stop_codon:yes gene_type:complete
MTIFIASKDILSNFSKFGGSACGLDATYTVTQYSFALFAIMGRHSGGGIPLAYFLSSSKSTDAVKRGLEMFIDALRLFNPEGECQSPAAFCIDKDSAEINAIKQVFPGVTVILCHFHFMMIIYSELRAGRHALTGDDIRNCMKTIRLLCSSTTVESFQEHLLDVQRIAPSFYCYFSQNFLNDSWIDTFSEVSRGHLPISVRRLCRSNMLVEVSFKTLKYIIFDGFQNKRLDECIYAIAFKLLPYFVAKYTCTALGTKPRFHLKLKVIERGALLLRYGHVSHLSDGNFDVLSGSGCATHNVRCISEILDDAPHVEYTCTCLQYFYAKNACSHIAAVRLFLGVATHTTHVERRRGTRPGPQRRYRPVQQRGAAERTSVPFY